MRDDFIHAACVPRTRSHASGTLDVATVLLAAHPELTSLDIHTAAIVGNDVRVRELLAADPSLATATSAPYGWDALTHLCFSRFLRGDDARTDAFVRTATALLDAGASAKTGFQEDVHSPHPTFESVLYGAAGVAHNAPMTKLLLSRGANPNDDEVPYHAPESYDLGAFRALLESRLMTADSLTTMLLRKSDWHDIDGMALAIEFGADVNATGRWGRTPLSHAIRSDNRSEIITLLLDGGANAATSDHTAPTEGMSSSGMSAITHAAWTGRGDLLRLFASRGYSLPSQGVDALVAACALGDAPRVAQLVADEPNLAMGVRNRGGLLMARFAGVGNSEGIRLLLELGVPVDATQEQADGYHNRASYATALHDAAWRARHDTVLLLLLHGANANALDSHRRSPLMLAVLANVESYWTDDPSPASVAALLAAGASVDGVRYPSGYAPVDALLQAHGAAASR